MKRSKEVYSKAFSDTNLSPERLKLLQDTLYDILLDIKRVCNRHNITFMLGYGTVLGAVRHKGFIPWDDDLDILMLRSEYEKFRNVFPDETEGKYELVEPLDGQYTNKKPKILLKNSVFTEVCSAGLPEKYRKVFVDVFIIENVPASPAVRKLVGVLYDFAYFASGMAADYLFPSPVILEKAKQNAALRKYYRRRRRLGHLFSLFFGMRFYIGVTEKLSHINRETGWVAVPASTGYTREVFPQDLFAELAEVKFRDEFFPVPAQYDRYLTMLYHDYLTLPPVAEREIHSCSEFWLPGDCERQ